VSRAFTVCISIAAGRAEEEKEGEVPAEWEFSFPSIEVSCPARAHGGHWSLRARAPVGKEGEKEERMRRWWSMARVEMWGKERWGAEDLIRINVM
jgi:hypothetical protein